MALQVGPVRNPTLNQNAPVYNPRITNVTTADRLPGYPTLTNLQRPSKPSPVSAAASQNNALLSQTNSLLAAIARLQNQQPRQVYAPALNFSATNAQARSAAENAVNPYYVKQLNDFLAAQAAKKQQAETQAKFGIEGLETDLANKIAENEITRTRTTEDVGQNLENLAIQEDQFQTDTGQQFDTSRLASLREAAQAGLTGGLGAQQQEAAQTARNTTEERQTAKFGEEKQQQELFKARTFEDLTRSGTLATESKERGVKQINVNLADFITNQGFETEGKKSQLEAERLGAVSREQSNQGRLLVNNFINSIADPARRNAAYQAYGGLF